MEVLALGLPRCDTDVLKFALQELGYNGITMAMKSKGTKPWSWLGYGKPIWPTRARTSGWRTLTDSLEITKSSLITFCMSGITRTTDLCTNLVPNRRRDVAAWDQSFGTTLVRGVRDDWWLKSLSNTCFVLNLKAPAVTKESIYSKSNKYIF